MHNKASVWCGSRAAIRLCSGAAAKRRKALAAAEVPFRIVPGITAALGATAYAGIPLTHRDYAQTALFITGHCRPDGDGLQWQTLARGKQTLVIYMGTVKAGEIAAQLMAHGRAADTPVAVVSNGTFANKACKPAASPIWPPWPSARRARR